MTNRIPFLSRFSKTADPVVFTIPRSFLTALLASVFVLAFIITDYWGLPDASWLKIVLLSATLLLGIAWSLLGSGKDIRVEINYRNLLFFCLLLVVMLVLNYRMLNINLPLGGDEDQHFMVTLDIYQKITGLRWWKLAAVLIGAALTLILSWRRPKWAILAGGLTLVAIFHLYPTHSYFGRLRYPYINYWVYFLAMFPAASILGPYHEVLYRIIPFLSAVCLAWIYQRDLPKKMAPLNLLWGLAIALIPSVFYYSSILYLEMPAVLLMTIVCLRSETLLSADFNELRQSKAWYALILIGFIKETALPFLVIYLFCRTAFTLIHRLKSARLTRQRDADPVEGRRSSFWQYLKSEGTIYFITLLPIVYYLVMRNFLSRTRSYHLNFTNLLDPKIYQVMLRSLFEQFGIFFLLFIVGAVLLILKKKYRSMVFFTVLILGFTLFYMLDIKGYIGYSRFNLFLLPPILAGSIVLIKELLGKWRWLNTVLLVVTILSSILLSPINPDGTKVPLWGNYLVDTSEHYYPVEEALLYLDKVHHDDNVLYAGLCYRYIFDFYTEKLGWSPSRSELFLSGIKKGHCVVNLNKDLAEADKKGFNNVMLFVMGESIPPLPDKSPYHQEAVIKNMAHEIVIFSRNQ